MAGKKRNTQKRWYCYSCSSNRTFSQKPNCIDCGKHWAAGASDDFFQFPSAQAAGPVSAGASQGQYPPAVANRNAASGAIPVGLVQQPAAGSASAPDAAATATNSSKVFRDADNKEYDVGLLRTARKTLEVLFGAEHHIVKEIDGKLTTHEQQQMRSAPLHIAVGKAQKRLKALETKVMKLTLDRATLVEQHACIVKGISDKDKQLAETKDEQRVVQEELAKMGGVQAGQGFDLTAIGLDQAPPAIRALAVTLLEQLKQLSAIVVAGPAAVQQLIAGNMPNIAEGSPAGPRVVLPPTAGVAQANAGFQAAAAGTPLGAAAATPIGAGPHAASASPGLEGALCTTLALPGVLSAGSRNLGGFKPTLIDSEAFGSPMGSASAAEREKSRTPEGGRPSRRRRIAARPKAGGFEASELDDDPVMDFSDTEDAVRLAALMGTIPALPGAAAAAGHCG